MSYFGDSAFLDMLIQFSFSVQATSTGFSTSDSTSAETDVTAKPRMTSQLLSSSTTSSTTVTTTGALDNTNSDKSHSSTGVRRSIPMAAIAGGIAAVALVLIILGVLVCLVKRRRSQKSIHLSGGSPITGMYFVCCDGI